MKLCFLSNQTINMGSRDSQISKISYDPIQDRMVSEAFKTDSKHTPLPTQRVMY